MSAYLKLVPDASADIASVNVPDESRLPVSGHPGALQGHADRGSPVISGPPMRLLPRLDLWKVTVCRNCGEPFEQLKNRKKIVCKECRAVSRNGGKR